MANDDMLFFAAEGDSASQPTSQEEKSLKPWKVMIVDDEPEVHAVTRLALSGFEFDRRGWNS
jgi:hypothetical protein